MNFRDPTKCSLVSYRPPVGPQGLTDISPSSDLRTNNKQGWQQEHGNVNSKTSTAKRQQQNIKTDNTARGRRKKTDERRQAERQKDKRRKTKDEKRKKKDGKGRRKKRKRKTTDDRRQTKDKSQK